MKNFFSGLVQFKGTYVGKSEKNKSERYEKIKKKPSEISIWVKNRKIDFFECVLVP